MKINVKAVAKFCETCGIKSILQTKPQSLKGLNSAGIKFAPKLEGDVVQILSPTKWYPKWVKSGFKAPDSCKSIKLTTSGIKVSQMLRDESRIPPSVKIPHTFLDGDLGIKITSDGKWFGRPQCEIVQVDFLNDMTLKKTIEKFQSKLTKHANASDEEKISMLMTYVDDIFSVNKDDEALLALTKKFPIGKNVRLGEIIDSGAGVCRHRSLLTKILGDHTGLNVSLVKGSYDDGAHAWNKFIASDGKKYLVDTMHRNLVNLSNDGIRDMRVLAYSQGRSSSYLYASEYQSTKKIFDYVLNNQPISLSGKATLYNTNGKFTLYPIENQKVTLNGKALQTASFIRNGDRIKYEGLDGKQVSIIWKTPNL